MVAHLAMRSPGIVLPVWFRLCRLRLIVLAACVLPALPPLLNAATSIGATRARSMRRTVRH
jgi:hypothetical protein